MQSVYFVAPERNESTKIYMLLGSIEFRSVWCLSTQFVCRKTHMSADCFDDFIEGNSFSVCRSINSMLCELRNSIKYHIELKLFARVEFQSATKTMAHNNIEFVRNKNQKGSKANAATTKSHKKDKTLFYLHTISNKTKIKTQNEWIWRDKKV